MRKPDLLKLGASCLMVVCIGLWVMFVTSCTRGGTITTPQASVTGVKDAGKPATLDTATTNEGVALPAGTLVTITKEASTPAVQDQKTGAVVVPAKPAREITTFTAPAPVRWERAQVAVSASTGTVDTSIAAKKIDSAESRPLLYASMVAAAVSAFFLYLKYPTPAMISAAAAVLFFIAWKVSDLPSWFWAAGAVALAAAAFLYFGHRRGESDAKSTSTP